jgi:hypothetical protein
MNYQRMFRQVVGVTLGFVLVGLLSATAYAAGPGPGQVYQAIPAANHCAGISSDAAGSTLLGANPELSMACRYASRVQEKRAESTFAAANPEAQRARHYKVAASGSVWQGKMDAIQRFGLAEVLATEKETASPDHKLWMPGYLGRISADDKGVATSRQLTLHDIQRRLDLTEYMEAAEK